MEGSSSNTLLGNGTWGIFDVLSEEIKKLSFL